jgi:hypothetical protein
MAVPNAYLTSTKNLKDILASIQQAQAPKQFTISFLTNLGFKSSADRLYIGVLKALGFLSSSGVPTGRYFEFLDQTQSARVLADGIRDAYGDLFELNTKANEMSSTEVKNKLKTVTQGAYSESVIAKMATTFLALCSEADFQAVEPAIPPPQSGPELVLQEAPASAPLSDDAGGASNPPRPPALRALGGLVYNIQIQLPESRDPVVYDALFRSLKTHLLSE